MKVLHVNSNNFFDVILNNKLVLIDFSAAWCGPCAKMAPVLDEFAAEHPEITVCKIDVDESPALAEVYDIESIPAFIAVKDGKTVGQKLGVCPKAALLSLFA